MLLADAESRMPLRVLPVYSQLFHDMKSRMHYCYCLGTKVSSISGLEDVFQSGANVKGVRISRDISFPNIESL